MKTGASEVPADWTDDDDETSERACEDAAAVRPPATRSEQEVKNLLAVLDSIEPSTRRDP